MVQLIRAVGLCFIAAGLVSGCGLSSATPPLTVHQVNTLCYRHPHMQNHHVTVRGYFEDPGSAGLIQTGALFGSAADERKAERLTGAEQVNVAAARQGVQLPDNRPWMVVKGALYCDPVVDPTLIYGQSSRTIQS